jgi:hypothetical protein
MPNDSDLELVVFHVGHLLHSEETQNRSRSAKQFIPRNATPFAAIRTVDDGLGVSHAEAQGASPS